MAPNRIELLELFAGLARVGAIQVPINAYLKGTFLRHQLSQSRSRVLVVDRAGRAAVDPLLAELPDLETIIHLEEPDTELIAGSLRREIRYSDVTLASRQRRTAADISPHDTMAIIYTSGTTGLPKGCVLSHGYYCRCGELNAAALELTDEDVLLASLPLFHAGGVLIVLMGALFRGITARFESSFSASAFFDRARVTQATVAIGVGAMGAALLASQPSSADRGHRLRTMMVAPMSPEAQSRFRDRFGIEPWTEVFGQTECMPITMTPLSSAALRWRLRLAGTGSRLRATRRRGRSGTGRHSRRNLRPAPGRSIFAVRRLLDTAGAGSRAIRRRLASHGRFGTSPT